MNTEKQDPPSADTLATYDSKSNDLSPILKSSSPFSDRLNAADLHQKGIDTFWPIEFIAHGKVAISFNLHFSQLTWPFGVVYCFALR